MNMKSFIQLIQQSYALQNVLSLRISLLVSLAAWAFCNAIFYPTLASSQPLQSSLTLPTLTLNDQNVIQIIRSNSIDLKEVEARTLGSQLTFDKVSALYKLNTSLDFSKEKDKSESTSSLLNTNTDRNIYSLLLSKRFLSGTLTALEFTHNDVDTNANPATATSSYNQNYFIISAEQNLFPNFFGLQDRAIYDAAQIDNDRAKLQNAFDLDSVTRSTLALYWRVKAALVSVTENEEIIQRYEKVTDIARRKKANSFASAGELEQAQAEFETRKQSTKQERTNYNSLVQQLREALNLPEQQNLIISTENAPATLPNFYRGPVRNLKRYMLQKLKTDSALKTAEAVEKIGFPELSLYAKYTQQGLDNSQTESVKELSDGNRNKYLVGLKLGYTFGDAASETARRLGAATAEIERSRMARIDDDLENNIETAVEDVKNAFDNIETTKRVLKLRQDAIRQITTNYTQGRTDISFLVDAINKKIQAEVAAVTAYGNYSLILQDYLSLTAE